MLKKYLIAFLVSMVPLIELRGGVPYAVLRGLDYWPSLIICAIGNMMMLILLYFTDYKGAMAATSVFAASPVIFTLLSFLFSNIYYGVGFVLSSLIFSIVAAVRLDYFTKRLPYYILSVQPLVNEEKVGIFTKLGNFLEVKLEEEKNDE